jgi:predicted AAA+ superfamily ATPase
MTNIQSILGQQLTDVISAPLPPLPALTRRDVRLPRVPRKAVAVIGVRRGGKTSFLYQCLADRLAAGRPRDSLLLLGLEDDRLAGITTDDLSWLVEEYYRRFPARRSAATVTLCLDEIQVVPAWEKFVRRLADTENIELLLSGSSAKLLSREIATALRGRTMEVLVHPFSFREALRHAGREPAAPWSDLPSAERSALDVRLREYLACGGFPEAQGLDARDRSQLLQGYVDTMVLRDVIDRHAVSNAVALRWLQRELLASPAGMFSINKSFNTLKSQGVSVGKDTLHAYLSHLEDAFLIRTVALHTASERQRMVNPRKAYPVDPGLIPIFQRTAEPQTGRALETAVLLELERREYRVGYVRTSDDAEVDFHASAPGRETLLLQVCADTRDAGTLERELRALVSARAVYPRSRAILLTMDADPPAATLPAHLEWQPAARWLLEDEGA